MKKKHGKSKTPGSPDSTQSNNVVDLTAARAKKTGEERRKVERFFIRDVLQIFCVLGPEKNEELLPIELLEVSESGFSFRVPLDKQDKIDPSTDMRLRIYMSRDTYLYLAADIMSSVPMMDHGSRYLRYGCRLDTTFASFSAYQQLIRFIEAYSLLASKERREIAGL